MIRKASATWTGGLRSGTGVVSTQTAVLKDVRYTFTTRFENEPGTNPEELVAAAHAACYSMALSAELERAGHPAQRVQTSATLTLEKLDAGWTTTGIRLDVQARVPGIDAAKFHEIAEGAKKGCPISRLLNTTITLAAALEA